MKEMNIAAEVLVSLPEIAAVSVMDDYDILPLQNTDWVISVKTPDDNVFSFMGQNWTAANLGEWLSKYPLNSPDCQVFAETVDGEVTVLITGFTVSPDTDPMQVIFYSE